MDVKSIKVCVVGLGYVGLPLALEFACRGVKVIGFDINQKRVEELKNCVDSSLESTKAKLEEAKNSITYTTQEELIREADYVIVAVQSPITEDKKPDLSSLEKASKTIGRNLKRGAIVVLESTVYPGVTEEFIAPILAKESALEYGIDFKVGYSPERMNPGDKEHNVGTVVKIVSGMDAETTEKVAELYSIVVKAGVFKAKSIRTAEAAKVIENTQRDINIALMNEFAIVFRKVGIDIWDVLDAAYTKWNFNRYKPGLVGGPCITKDPYFLVHKAKQVNYEPRVILSGRGINDYMPQYIGELVVEALNKNKKVIRNANALIMGLAFKENVTDVRNSPSRVLVAELVQHGLKVVGYDPMLNREEAEKEFKIKVLEKLEEVKEIDCIIVTVAHEQFKKLDFKALKEITSNSPVLVDVRNFLKKEEVEKVGFTYVGL